MNDKHESQNKVGGVLHTYTKYDPVKFPSPTQPPPDIVSPLMNQMMSWGSARQLTEEELANAIRLDPEQFKNLGPSLDMIKAMLEDRRRKILQTYETKTVQFTAKKVFRKKAKGFDAIPKEMRAAYKEAVAREQLYDLENLWYRAGDDASDLAMHLMGLMGNLGDKYQIDELASKWHFTGHESMTIPQALEIKEELEKIEELLEQVEQASESAQIAILDMDQLGEFMDDETMHSLEEMKKQIDEYVEQIASQQGLNKKDGKYELTPQAVRTFQGKLLARIFSHLKASNSGRHQANIQGEGAVELQETKPYEFGDSITQMDIPQTFINALIRDSSQSPIRLKSEDIEIHRTRNNPKAATVIVMDMSGSMRYDGQYINVKRMAMAMDGLIRSEYPGDYLNFIEMYTFGKLRRHGEIIELMPKPVTIHDPFVQLKVDMSRPEVSEHMVHQHFTNIQRSFRGIDVVHAISASPGDRRRDDA